MNARDLNEQRPIMKIAVTGAGGQLGQELLRIKSDRVEMIGLDRLALDITDAEDCVRVFKQLSPDVIIHAAAYTAVDTAETDRDTAYKVNVDGTRNVAQAAESIGAKLCYVSTDYVFDGRATKPYEITDRANPQTEYGRTKLEGEREASEHCSRAFIVRTSWVFGLYGKNFVRTILQLAARSKKLSVVDDQRSSPTYTHDLALFLTDLVSTSAYGTYHASNSGICSWYEFASAILEKADVAQAELHPCTTAEYPRPAARPVYSALSNESLKKAGFEPFRHWKEALDDFLQEYLIEDKSRSFDNGY